MDAPDLEPLRGALVAAVDDSPPAREALRFAVTLASDAGKPLHVLMVWNFVMGPFPEQSGDQQPSEARWQQEAEERLAALVAEEVGEGSKVEVTATALHGNTTPTLLDVSRVAGHLVLGSRGRGGFSGLLLGSTSQQLVQHADCPVTIVRQGCTD